MASGNSILSGLQLNPDSVAVQSYLTSKNAMLRLDEEAGFMAAFQDPSLDPLSQSLRPSAPTIESACRPTAGTIPACVF